MRFRMNTSTSKNQVRIILLISGFLLSFGVAYSQSVNGPSQVCINQAYPYSTSGSIFQVFNSWQIIPGTAGTIVGSPTSKNTTIVWNSGFSNATLIAHWNNGDVNLPISNNGPVFATLVVNGNPTICQGQGSANLVVNIAGGFGPFSFMLNGYGAVSNYTSGTNIPVSPGSTTNYSLTSLVTGSNGCSVTGSGNVSVTVNPSPVPSLTGPSAVCSGSSGNVYTTEPGMTNYAWNVSSGGTVTAGGTSASSSVTVTWNTAGPQSVSVNYTGANGCAAVSPTVNSVTVNPTPTSAVLSVNGSSTICQGQSANLVVTITGGTSPYSFTIGGYGAVSNYVSGTNIPVSPSSTTIYTIGTVTTATGCTVTGSGGATVTVNPLPVPSFTGGPSVVCVGTANNTYTTQTGMSNYIWSVSAGGRSPEEVPPPAAQ